MDKRPVQPHLDAYAEKRAVEEGPAYRERVFDLVRQIPPGRVMTYGQIAEILGAGYTARTVGFVMHAASSSAAVPWQRVINAQGGCSTTRFLLPPDQQQQLLAAEGIIFDDKGRCNLKKYRWLSLSATPPEQPALF